MNCITYLHDYLITMYHIRYFIFDLLEEYITVMKLSNVNE